MIKEDQHDRSSTAPPVLVVEDDPAVAGLLADFLSSHGYDVCAIDDGRRVLPHLASHPCRLVILDLLVPYESGFALVERIRDKPNLLTLPIIVVSGIYSARNHRTRMMSQYGVIEFLNKPFDVNTLLELVIRTVGKPPPRPPAKKPIAGPSSHGVTEDSLADAEALSERKLVERAARRDFRSSAFVMQGTIKKRPVARLLGRLWHEGAAGALLLRQDRKKKIIYLQGGSAYAVKSNLVSECLGRLLVREGLITREECEESIRRMREARTYRQGEILLQMDAISESNLRYGLEMQLETKLFEPFSWENGEFRFSSSAPTAEHPGVELTWHGPSLVIEGVRRAFDETRLRSRMLAVLDVPVEYSPLGKTLALKTLRLTPQETRALAAIRFPKTTRELLTHMDLPPPTTLRVIYSLIALELLTPVAPR